MTNLAFQQVFLSNEIGTCICSCNGSLTGNNKNGSDETTNEDNMGLTYAKSFYFP